MKTIPALIHATLANGGPANAPFYDVNITQELCQAACCDETPYFKPQFSIRSVQNVGTNQYVVVIHVEGAISYIPCCCGCCQTRTQVVSQDFTIPLYRTTAPTVTLTTGDSANGMARRPCCQCSRIFVSETPLTLTIA